MKSREENSTNSTRKYHRNNASGIEGSVAIQRNKSRHYVWIYFQWKQRGIDTKTSLLGNRNPSNRLFQASDEGGQKLKGQGSGKEAWGKERRESGTGKKSLRFAGATHTRHMLVPLKRGEVTAMDPWYTNKIVRYAMRNSYRYPCKHIIVPHYVIQSKKQSKSRIQHLANNCTNNCTNLWVR